MSLVRAICDINTNCTHICTCIDLHPYCIQYLNSIYNTIWVQISLIGAFAPHPKSMAPLRAFLFCRFALSSRLRLKQCLRHQFNRIDETCLRLSSQNGHTEKSGGHVAFGSRTPVGVQSNPDEGNGADGAVGTMSGAESRTDDVVRSGEWLIQTGQAMFSLNNIVT